LGRVPKGDKRREKGLRRFFAARDDPPEVPERYETATTTQDTIYLDLTSMDQRVVVRQDRHEQTGELLSFAIMQETQVEERWMSVVRVDCAPGHGGIHLHRFRLGGGEPIRETVLGPLDDLDAGMKLAEDKVYDAWEENLRRFREGRVRGPREG
jgi:hypothetical protein